MVCYFWLVKCVISGKNIWTHNLFSAVSKVRFFENKLILSVRLIFDNIDIIMVMLYMNGISVNLFDKESFSLDYRVYELWIRTYKRL